MPDDLVTVATFDNDLDASLARQCLVGAGIKSFLADHSTVATAWHLTGALGGVKLQVANRDRDEAIEVLAQAQAGELEVAESEWPEDDDEGDGSDEPALNAREKTVDRASKSLVLSLLFFPLALYTGWLLLDVATSEGELSASHRRRASIVAAVTLILLAIFLVFLRGTVRGMLRS